MPSKDRNEKASAKKQAEDNGHKIGKFGQPKAPPADTSEYHVAYCTICQASVVASLTTDGRWLRGGTALDKVCAGIGLTVKEQEIANDGIQAAAQKLVEEIYQAMEDDVVKNGHVRSENDPITCLHCYQKLSDPAPIPQGRGEMVAPDLKVYQTPCPALLALETEAAWQAALTIPRCDISASAHRLLLAIGVELEEIDGGSGAPGDHVFKVTLPEGTAIEKLPGVKDHVKDVIIYSPPANLLSGMDEGVVLALGWFAEEQIGDVPQLYMFTAASRPRAYQRERIAAHEEHQRIQKPLREDHVRFLANGEIEDVPGAPTPSEAGFTHDIGKIHLAYEIERLRKKAKAKALENGHKLPSKWSEARAMSRPSGSHDLVVGVFCRCVRCGDLVTAGRGADSLPDTKLRIDGIAVRRICKMAMKRKVTEKSKDKRRFKGKAARKARKDQRRRK